MVQLKRERPSESRTASQQFKTVLHLLLRPWRHREEIPVLPTFRSGGSLVEIADRDALYQGMEGR